MATEIRLPDLGEGIEDATINRWLHQVGDAIEEGAALLEVATDKVDTEIPAPASGTLLKIAHNEGDLVTSGTILGFIGEAGEEVPEEAADAEGGSAESAAERESEQSDEPATAPTAESVPSVSPPAENGAGVKASPVAKRVAAEKGISLSSVAGSGPGGRITKDDVLAAGGGGEAESAPALPGELADNASLVVRRLASLHNILISDVADGRPLSTVTRYDVLSAVASRDAGEPVTVAPRFEKPSGWSQSAVAPAAAPEPAKSTGAQPAAAKPVATPAVQPGEGEELVPHTRMRQLIAKNMAESASTKPHVTTMWDVNMAPALAHRAAHKAEFAEQGVNLTVTAYLAMAAIAGLKAVPAANSTYTEEGLLIKRYINLGVAVALPQDSYGLGGLIVPVIKNAGELNLLGIARAVNDVAERARNSQLVPDDLQGGTFTLTNYGTSGSRFQTPIIAQSQAGILGVGAIEKRAVVVSQGHPLEANTGDYLTFQPMTTLGFSYDHRILDGATADAYCKAVKEALEGWA
ncbi:MAG: dihydrolipoamide acetyltransferase family protein [Caldilineaceae bacterium]